MKKIYEFTIWKEEEKDGSKTYSPKKFFLKKPNRALSDDAELFYNLELSSAIKLGMLTKAQLATKFADEIGTFSKKDRQRYSEIYLKLMGLETEFQTKSLKKNEERSEDEKKEVEKIAYEIIDLRDELQNIESTQQSLFDHTAETRSRNRLILWWSFNLSYFDDGKPVFGDGSFEEKLKQYDIYEEADDSFMTSVAQKILYLVSFWFTGRAEKPEDFDTIAKSIGVNIDPNEVKEKDKKKDSKKSKSKDAEDSSPPEEVK